MTRLAVLLFVSYHIWRLMEDILSFIAGEVGIL